MNEKKYINTRRLVEVRKSEKKFLVSFKKPDLTTRVPRYQVEKNAVL